MYTYIVGVSRNDRQVYVSIINSAAGRAFSRYPYLVSMAKTVIEAHDLTDKELHITQDMGHTIGNTNIVATDAKDIIFYARLLKQSQTLRFVKNRSMELSSELSIALLEDSEGNYELKDVWIGPGHPPFPDASDTHVDSRTYWLNHALTADSEHVDLQTMTKICPY